MQNLESYAINFFYWIKYLGKSDDYMLYSKNKIKVEWVWLYKVSKHISRLVVRLKAIKYKKDFFCYLFF